MAPAQQHCPSGTQLPSEAIPEAQDLIESLKPIQLCSCLPGLGWRDGSAMKRGLTTKGSPCQLVWFFFSEHLFKWNAFYSIKYSAFSSLYQVLIKCLSPISPKLWDPVVLKSNHNLHIKLEVKFKKRRKREVILVWCEFFPIHRTAWRIIDYKCVKQMAWMVSGTGSVCWPWFWVHEKVNQKAISDVCRWTRPCMKTQHG